MKLPEDWIEARLEQIADVILGQSPPGDSYNEDRVGFPFLQGKAEFGDLRPTIRKWTTDPRKIAQADDVLLSVRAPVGPTNLAPCECVIGRGLAALRPLGGIDSRYVLYGMRDTVDALSSRATGTTFAAVSGSHVRSHLLPVAPLREQGRIVAAIEEHFSRLDAAQASISRAKRNLQRMARAVLWSAFDADWPRQPLVELTDPARPICYGILKPKTTGDLSVPYVEVRSIRGGQIDLNSLHRTTEALHSEFRRSELRAGDVVLAIRGSFDRAAVVPPELEGANVSRDVARIAPAEALDSGFLARYLGGPHAYSYFAGAARGVAVRGVNIGDLRTMPVPVPPQEEQQGVVAKIDQQLSILDALDNEIDRALRRGAALRRLILEHAFTGKLVAQDPSDEPASILLERIAAERALSPKPSRRERKIPA